MPFAELSRNWGIALTGGIASGKSTVALSLRRRGFVVLDADQVSRLVVKPGSIGLQEVVQYFGPDILSPSGEMDRAKMRDLVFADESKRLKLESIIHQRLSAVSEELLRAEGLFDKPRHWFYEASLIFERDRAKDFAQVWVAYCPPEVQIARLIERDKGSREQAQAILKAQMSPEDKVKRATLVINTDCDRIELERRIDQAVATLPGAAQRSKT